MPGFEDYCELNEIGNYIFDKKTNSTDLFFTVDDIKKMDFIVNASRGGLLLGNSHKDGGIKVIQQNTDHRFCDQFPFKLVAEFEGNEYLVPPEILELHRIELGIINDSIKPSGNYEFNSFEKDFRCKVINLTKKEHHVIYLEPKDYYIINSLATKMNIERIIEMDTILT